MTMRSLFVKMNFSFITNRQSETIHFFPNSLPPNTYLNNLLYWELQNNFPTLVLHLHAVTAIPVKLSLYPPNLTLKKKTEYYVGFFKSLYYNPLLLLFFFSWMLQLSPDLNPLVFEYLHAFLCYEMFLSHFRHSLQNLELALFMRKNI